MCTYESFDRKLLKPLKNPSGDTYNEGCGPNGVFAYGISTGTALAYILMGQMENEYSGNYSGSTAGMIGNLTAIGYTNALSQTQKGAGPTYLLVGSSVGTTYLNAYIEQNTPQPPPVSTNGACGIVDGIARASVPTTDLCSAGTETTVTTTATGYFWSCQGSGGGTDDDCSAPNIYAACTASGETYTATTTYPGCDEADKIICHGVGAGYIWAMCNDGSTSAGTTCTSYGSIFQWGRNLAFPSTGTIATTTGPVSLATAEATGAFITGPAGSRDWLNPEDSNRWGGFISAGSIIYQNASTSDQILMQGPCANGYHVPTFTEGRQAVLVLSGATYIATLKVPLSGYRNRSTSTITSQGINGFWWLSDPISSRAYRAMFSSTTANILTDFRAVGFNVRCMKN